MEYLNNSFFHGYVRGFKRDASGLITPFEGKNLVVNSGKALIASLLAGEDDPISHVAIGSSNTVAAESHTALIGTEHERVSATVAAVDNVLSVSGEFGAGVTGDVSVAEFGLFNAASGGVMLARFTINPITLESTSTINMTWTLQFGD